MTETPHGQSPRPGFDEAFRQACAIASQKLLLADLALLCRRSATTLLDENGRQSISLSYLGRECRVQLPDVLVSAVNGEALSQRDMLLILHYLVTADGLSLSGKPLTFRELPEGGVYYPTFVKRCVKPLLDRFADRPEALVAAAESIGGVKAETGDFSFRILALPRVPVTVTLWLGDEELPPEGNILFDSTVTGYLATEDVTVLCEILAWKLSRSA